MRRKLGSLVFVLAALAVSPGIAGASHVSVTDGPPPFDFANAINVKTSLDTPFGSFPATYWLKAIENQSSCPPTCFKLIVPNTPLGPANITGITNCLNVFALSGHDATFRGVVTTSNNILMPVGSVIVARLYDGNALSIPAFQQGPDTAALSVAPASPPSLCFLLPRPTAPISGGIISVHDD
jgi:hypothetical protein